MPTALTLPSWPVMAWSHSSRVWSSRWGSGMRPSLGRCPVEGHADADLRQADQRQCRGLVAREPGRLVGGAVHLGAQLAAHDLHSVDHLDAVVRLVGAVPWV